MKKTLAIIVLLAIAVAGAWYLSIRQDQKALEQVRVEPPPKEAEAEPPPITYPVEQIRIAPPPVPEPEPEPLPSLADSDAEITGHLSLLVGAEALQRYLVLDMVISRCVATIDSLPSARVAPLMLPVRPVEGKFQVLVADDEAVISPQNAERYRAYVELFDALDTQQAVSLYVRYYPLFQEAYQELGYPDAYFNDRLVEVIDHLLAAPEPAGPIQVVQNEANFEYLSQDLEALSAGQKILVRMGGDNARTVKEQLREVRALVTGPQGPAAEPPETSPSP